MSAKKIRTISLIIALIFVAYGIISLIIGFVKHMNDPTSYYIFADISECENLLRSENEGAKFVKYDTPSKDKELKNLEYESFFAGSS